MSLAITSRALQPGEAVLVTISAPAEVTSVTVAAFGAERRAYRVEDTQWRALLGIDLDQKPGTYAVVAAATGTTPLHATRELVVSPKSFRRRALRVAPDYVNPPPELLARITSEAALTREVYERPDPEPSWQAGFTRPVPDPANSSFGTRSVFNGEPRSPHAGTDFLSPAGTPIHAPAGGRVAVARDLFFTGNTVIIDHGSGVFSMLAHLSRLDVAEGQRLNEGDVIGLVGATGRVTGPHLHWALRIGAARVDALSALTIFQRSQ
jgi:murein DD-endopeptidase MepM/ murein hydrolase activator NlpD